MCSECEGRRNSLVTNVLDSHVQVPSSKLLGASKVDSICYSSEVDQMSTINASGLTGKKKTASS